jgi:hypothetical protein
MSKWFRSGRGRSFVFFMMDDEFLKSLASGLGTDAGQYLVYTVLSEKQKPRGWVHRLISFGPEAFASQLADPVTRNSNWLLLRRDREKAFRDAATQSLLDEDAVALRLGAVLIQPSRVEFDGRVGSFRIGCASRWQNASNGQIVDDPETVKLFERLQRQFKRLLPFSSIHDFPDGTSLEDGRERMSENAAEASAAGTVKFTSRAGRRMARETKKGPSLSQHRNE